MKYLNDTHIPNTKKAHVGVNEFVLESEFNWGGSKKNRPGPINLFWFGLILSF